MQKENKKKTLAMCDYTLDYKNILASFLLIQLKFGAFKDFHLIII